MSNGDVYVLRLTEEQRMAVQNAVVEVSNAKRRELGVLDEVYGMLYLAKPEERTEGASEKRP